MVFDTKNYLEGSRTKSCQKLTMHRSFSNTNENITKRAAYVGVADWETSNKTNFTVDPSRNSKGDITKGISFGVPSRETLLA